MDAFKFITDAVRRELTQAGVQAFRLLEILLQPEEIPAAAPAMMHLTVVHVSNTSRNASIAAVVALRTVHAMALKVSGTAPPSARPPTECPRLSSCSLNLWCRCSHHLLLLPSQTRARRPEWKRCDKRSSRTKQPLSKRPFKNDGAVKAGRMAAT